MPTDTLTLHALAKELDGALKGARIDKIYQPEGDEVTLLVRAENQNKLLVISANPSVPRLYISKQKKDNPINAPAFCMLLRKHLTSSRIQGVELYANDRIIRITCLSKNEMMDEVTIYLYFEYMGRYSNLIVTNGDGKILDVLRRVSLDCTRSRKLLPGFAYSPPTQDKISIFDSELSHAVEFSGLNTDILLKSCSGLSRESAAELLWRAQAYSSVSEGFTEELNKILSHPAPTVGYDASGAPVDFFVSAYSTLDYEYALKGTLSEAMEECYTSKDTRARIKSKTKHFHTVVRNAITRCEKKLGVNRQKLLDCEKAELDRIKGELLNANLYKIERGMTSVVLFNYYDGSEITVPLDGTKTPAQNAQNYFRRYTKLKRTKEAVERMIAENVETLHYLRSLLYDIESATVESDVSDVEQALIECGLIDKKGPRTKQAQKPSTPYKYLFEGVEIFVGRNNVQNDNLTFKSSQRGDTWLHVKGYHGSHVIVKSQVLTNALLTFCAEIAAYYSEARSSTKVEVDYTIIKNVKRHPSKHVGLVVYDDYSTIIVTPDAHEEYRIK